jgi:polar amino acid transport system permease protein
VSDEAPVNAQPEDHALTAEPIKAIPDRHPWRWVSAAVVLLLVAMLVHSLFFSSVVRNGQLQPRFQWRVVGHYLTWPTVVKGLEVTLFVTAIAMLLGIVLGVVAAVCRLSVNPVLSTVSWFYIWFFRGTPVYVQLLFWYSIAYLYPTFTLGVPFGPSLVTFNSNVVVTAIVAGIAGLGLNEGAYMAEIVRAGILSVDEGQTEAAQSIGMTRIQTLRRIVLPQAMRVIIPPVGNETISMLKTSSLVSAITVAELTFSVQAIYAVNYETVPLLMVASLWYLAVTSVLTAGQYYVERHYARGAVRELPPTPLQRFRGRISGLSRPAPTLNALAAEELVIFGQQNKD